MRKTLLLLLASASLAGCATGSIDPSIDSVSRKASLCHTRMVVVQQATRELKAGFLPYDQASRFKVLKDTTAPLCATDDATFPPGTLNHLQDAVFEMMAIQKG